MANGQEVIDALNSKFYDLIILDCQMPVMDGYTATQRIRAQAKWATLPIIAMTANAMADDQRACMDAGMNDFIGKPFQIEQMLGRLGHWLKSRHQANQ